MYAIDNAVNAVKNIDKEDKERDNKCEGMGPEKTSDSYPLIKYALKYPNNFPMKAVLISLIIIEPSFAFKSIFLPT